MTQIIEQTGILPSSLMAAGSRYLTQDIIYYGEKRLITFATYKRNIYIPNGKEKVMLITKGTEYRPDLVSYDVYGFVDNWWKILEANKMKDVWEFIAGKTILLPNVVSV
jgi:hypothetical protein